MMCHKCLTNEDIVEAYLVQDLENENKALRQILHQTATENEDLKATLVNEQKLLQEVTRRLQFANMQLSLTTF
jgi:hypothetical protein